ncbi:MAG TPA: alpha/beta hydrolase [Steroidobacteraceae bacterium]|nr:alpha/beta hydrolase [Steroidobacteraceae bacterium]
MRRRSAVQLLPALALLLLLVWGVSWWQARPTPVALDGYHVAVYREGRGSPVVVFESGLSGGIESLRPLQDQLAEHTETLSYERAGFDRSDHVPQPRTAEEIARELDELLGRLGIDSPVVLACYSAGCFYSRVFAHEYPQAVAALVLIDPAPAAPYAALAKSHGAVWAAQRNALSKRGREEWDALPQTLAQLERASTPVTVPVLLITALKPSGAWPVASRADMNAWLRGDQQMLAQFGVATHVILPQATHRSVIADPEVAKAILQLIGRQRVQ